MLGLADVLADDVRQGYLLGAARDVDGDRGVLRDGCADRARIGGERGALRRLVVAVLAGGLQRQLLELLRRRVTALASDVGDHDVAGGDLEDHLGAQLPGGALLWRAADDGPQRPRGRVDVLLIRLIHGHRYTDLGPDYVASRTDRDKKIRNHVRQLQALGLQVTLTPAA